MPGRPVRIFVAIGNSPAFPRLLTVVERLSHESDRFEWFVQSGWSEEQFPTLPGKGFVSREEFAERLAWADLVICHAGAGTIFEARLAGHTPIVVPRLRRHGEHINDHQLELGRALEGNGAGLLCTDTEALPEILESAPVRGERRSAETGGLVRAVEAALRGELPPRPRTGLWQTLKMLRARARLGRAVSGD